MKTLFRTLSVLFFMVPNGLSAQVLNGAWSGNYSKNLMIANPEELIVEFTVYNDSLVTGVSHLYYKNKKYEHHKIEGIYSPNDSTLVFEESHISTNINRPVGDAKYKMKLISEPGKWRLEGKWKPTKGILGYSNNRTIWLEKQKPDSLQPAVIKGEKAGGEKVNTDQKQNRITDVQQIIEIKSAEKDSVKISIYDNGEVDGDSISVYKDDELVIQNKMISVKPIVIYFSLDKVNSFHKIKMVAENLGTIPPNTALMIVETATKRYEVNMSSNYEKNAAIEFVLLE